MLSEDHYLSIIRIAFGSILFVKVFFSIKCFDFHWAHISKKERYVLKYLLIALTFLSVCFTLGLFTFYVSLIIFLLFVYLWYKSSVYGLEDIYFYGMILYMVLLSPDRISLDQLFTLPTYKLSLSYTPIPHILLILHVTITFYSGAIEKLSSNMWLKGLGVYNFFVFPSNRNFSLKFFSNKKKLMIFFNYAQFVSQFFFIFFIILFPLKFSNPFFLSTVIFIFFLITCFQFSWLAHCCLLMLIAPVYFLINNQDLYMANLLYENILTINIYEQILVYFILFNCLLGFVTLTFNVYFLEKQSIRFQKILKFFKILPRLTLGFNNIRAFTELHLKNIFCYQLFYKNDSKDLIRLDHFYKDNGNPNIKKMWWLPTCYMTTKNKLIDITLELKVLGKISPSKKMYLDGWINYLNNKYNLNNQGEIIVKINKYIAPEGYIKSYEDQISDKMYEYCVIDVNKKEIKKIDFNIYNPEDSGRYIRDNFGLIN
tara:strand:- start:5018 stop:6469 length:1452 start_codon:yes stop_codon:yes gene_type:complete